ncbi:MAG: oligosaccharide flippase family protein, partial [bacterium]|nr:oligosaccharide flippase family protein [bacterium]
MNSDVQANGEGENVKQAPPIGRLRTRLIKGAVGSFGLQVGFAGLAFLNAIILARVLGAEGYGAFSNAMAWVSLLTIPATFGFGILLVRDTAIYRSQGKWALLKGLLRFSNRIVLVLSIVLALSAAVLAGFLFSLPTQTLMRHTVWVALLLLPLFAMYNLRQATMRGLEHVIYARLPGMIVRPGLLFVGIVSLYYFLPARLSAPAAMMANVGAGVVALTLGVLFLHKLFPMEAKEASSEYTPRPWLKAAFPMMVYGGAQILLGQTDIVMLGVMRSEQEVGFYTAANRLAFLLVYVVMAAETILAPTISRLYSNNERKQ